MQIVPGRMKYLDYHGGSQFHLRLDGDELSYMGLIEDIHRSVGDDVPINGVNCICGGFLTTIYNDVGVLKMWDTIKAERDQKFHLFVTMVTPDMMQPSSNEDVCEGIQFDEGIQQTAEDVVNDFLELFEIREAFVDADRRSVPKKKTMGKSENDDSENEEGGRYFEKFQTGGPCVDMRCGYVSNQSTEYDHDDDFTPQDVEKDEVVCNLVNEATNLEEGADDVIDSLGLGTSNLYQGESIPSVEDEDIKEDNKLKLEPGMQWKLMPECRSYLKSLAIQDIFSFKKKQNDTKDLNLLKFVGTHTCEADGKNHVKQAKAPWVAQVLEDFLRDHPNMKPLDVHKEVWRRFGVELSYYTTWKAKVKMFEKINGNYEASYLVVSELKKQIDIKNVEIGDEVLPPPLERKIRERPRKQRIRDADEERPSKKRVCKLCHVPGHNKRTCPMREQAGTKGMSKAKKRQRRGEGECEDEANMQQQTHEQENMQLNSQENVYYQETHQENVQVNSQTNVHSQENVQVEHIPRAGRGGRTGRRGRAGRRGRGTGRGMAYWFGEDTPASSSQATPPPPLNETQ
ncbi:hypothetical protein IFM89_028633 [Coptis chinensis]|uniref:Uncharacterized protein n=1 Tax=Coptis chinensis TaxID=261450 RepID=A0A835IGS9_9MAGN|nr:hypothetical protein IFM89_028633 [Coptis chinensis]